MAIAVGRPQVRHAQILFQRPRSADQFAEDGPHAAVGKRALAECQHATEHLVLASRSIGGDPAAVLELADLQRHLGPLVHQLDQFLVDPIDLAAQAGNRRRACASRGTLFARFLLGHKIRSRRDPCRVRRICRGVDGVKELPHLVLGSNPSVKRLALGKYRKPAGQKWPRANFSRDADGPLRPISAGRDGQSQLEGTSLIAGRAAGIAAVNLAGAECVRFQPCQKGSTHTYVFQSAEQGFPWSDPKPYDCNGLWIPRHGLKLRHTLC